MIDSRTSDVDRNDVIQLAADVFFRHSRRDITPHAEREEIVQMARHLVLKYPYNPDRCDRRGRAIPIQKWFERLMRFSWYAWCADREERKAFSLDYGDRDLIMSFDPTTTPDAVNPVHCEWAGRGVLAALMPDMVVSTPPYRVVWPKTVQLSKYREDPFHIPSFIIEPNVKDDNPDLIAIGVENGRRRSLHLAEVAAPVVDALIDTRQAFALSVRELVPEYLRRYGYSSLKPELKAILRDVTRDHLRPLEIMATRGLTRKAYERRLAQLRSRGWFRQYDFRAKREVLRYNPVHDGKRSLLRLAAVRKVESLTLGDLFECVEPTVTFALKNGGMRSAEFRRELKWQRKELVEQHMDLAAEQDYHENLCSLITAIIERPTYGRNVSLDEMDRFIGLLPLERQKSLLFTAIQNRISVVDAMNLSDRFADAQLSPSDAPRTIADLHPVIKSPGKPPASLTDIYGESLDEEPEECDAFDLFDEVAAQSEPTLMNLF